MGDASDRADIGRFLRSPEGRERLRALRQSLLGRRIEAVDFSNEVHAIGISIGLSDGASFTCQQVGLDLRTLREEHFEALEREYYKDFPERAP